MRGKGKMVNRPYGDLDPLNIEDEGVEVFHETGLTPRQLAEHRAELLEALADAVSHYGRSGGPWNVLEGPGAWIAKARAAIARAKGEKA